MKNARLAAAAMIVFGNLSATSLCLAAEEPAYTIGARVALGGADKWDFLTFDPQSARVYVAHADRVDVVDSARSKRIGAVRGVPGGTHGIVVMSPYQAFTDDGTAGFLVPFDPKTFLTQAPIAVGADADAIVLDPLSHNLFVIDSDAGVISVVDPRVSKKVVDIVAGGKLEYAVADDRGHIYVNGESLREIVRVNTKKNRIDARWPIPACESPHGLALDGASHRLFAGCRNARAIVIDADSGAKLAEVPIGRGSDGVVFDPVRRRLLSANGIDGTLSVIDEIGPNTFAARQPVKTMVSGRTLALDPKTGRVFVAAAMTDPAKSPRGRAVPRPGTLELMVLEPPVKPVPSDTLR